MPQVRTFFQSGYSFLQILYLTVSTAILLIYIVEEFLDTEHITMVCYGYTFHSISHSLVYQTWNRRLAIKDGILGMDM